MKGKKVLEVGCGGGYGANIIAGIADSVIAVDTSEETILRATENYKKTNLRFFCIKDGALPFLNGEFDVVISFQVIEHVKDELYFLNEIKRVLKKDGLLLLTTPNAKHRLLPFQRPWNKHHRREYRYGNIMKLLGRNFASVDFYGLFADKNIFERETQRMRQAALYNLLKKYVGKTTASIVMRPLSLKQRQFFNDKKGFISEFSLRQFFFRKESVAKSLNFFAVCKN